MEENPSSTFLDGQIVGITFGLATHKEICTASISGCPISHASQLANPFLGLPLEFGRCESCGASTSEVGKCEGHFGYIELPIPIYHPSHISELKRMLSLLCLKCLKLKTNKFQIKDNGIAQRLLSPCCEEASLVSIGEVKTTDGASYLQLKLPSKFRLTHGFWNFLERYGFRYGDNLTRTLLPFEVKEMLKRIPADTRKKLAGKGYFPQDGYILEFLPVPPNCLSVPDVSDGVSVMSSDLSLSMLKKVLKQVEIIKSSRSGIPNFESQEVEANDLQLAVGQYLEVRGTAKASHDIDTRYGVTEDSNSSTKAWLEKMRTLFIRKGSGFSSRSVITGDSYKKVNEIGIPFEIAQRITFEERVNRHNQKYLQELVDNKLCLTYGDGISRYSLREGSKGHTFLRPGQVVHRRIMDGDTVFVNRPPTTHKHSLQALSVYVHDDHTVKINPLICGPLSADFDGDCIHLFYPQSLAAKAEVAELFSVEKQLLSSHSGSLNLQLATDSLLSLKVMFRKFLLDKRVAQQLAMFVLSPLPPPALLKGQYSGSYWTALQMLQTVLPACFDCCGDRYLIRKSEVLKLDFSREVTQSLINEIVTSIFFEKGSIEVLKFFDSLQPLLMENLFVEGFSVSLEDFSISKAALHIIQNDIKDISHLLDHLRSTHNEMVELQVEKDIWNVKVPVANFILKSSALGNLIDSKSDSAVSKVVQQTGFLGLQLSDRGKFYSKTLVEDVASHFNSKYPLDVDYPSTKYGLIKGCFFHGLDPYEEMVHSISSREVIVRSSRGLSEPGTLFKNLMAVLRDVVICYDGTVRNVCSNSVIQFEYGLPVGNKPQSLLPAGEPVGVLAATAMSNPAYKAVLDSSPNSNSSWELMKEILLCKVSFKNDLIDRRVILFLNDCGCGRKYCRERADMVKNQLKRFSLKDIAVKFLIEYKKYQTVSDNFGTDAGLVAHVHLDKMLINKLELSMHEILQRCQETIKSCCKKKKLKKHARYFKNTVLSVSECCSFEQSCADENIPCLMFFFPDTSDGQLDRLIYILSNMIYPVLLETIIRGDPRICSANIVWISPDTTTWIRNPSNTQKGELALDIVLEKSVVKQSGDAWRIVLDSCLSVLHLIDTSRSVPYAIKQVQELLGISCAFEQAIQRLSTSVTMVAKGIRKEHLILLGNSMTCAGNLVGFNSGGYKALSRSFNVQVPFTEATLFTPRKCFEKAAEKCHVDNLTSVVASCSWGKHVAVGTGSRFDVLWDPKMLGFNQEEKTDVYNFLHMVRSSTGVEESSTGCLGAEVDFLEEDEMADWNLSPENSSFDKPVFEDGDNQQEGMNWEKVSVLNDGLHGGGDWGTNNAWSKAETQDSPGIRLHQEGPKSSSWDSSWGKRSEDKFEKLEKAAAKSWSNWGTQEVPSSEAQEDSSKSIDWVDAAPSWGKKNVNSAGSWGREAREDETELRGNNVQPLLDQSREPSEWNDKVTQGKASQSSAGWNTIGSWEAKAEDNFENMESSGAKPSSVWGVDAKAGNDRSWGPCAKGGNARFRGANTKGGNDWSSGPDARGGNDWLSGSDAKGSNDWLSGSDAKGGNDGSWRPDAKGSNDGSWRPDAKGGNDGSWGANTEGGNDWSSGPGAKGSNDGSWRPDAKGGNDGSWRPDGGESNGSSWDPVVKGGNDSSWPDAKDGNDDGWGQQKSVEVLHGWNKANESSQMASTNDWSVPNERGGNESEKHQWGQPRGPWKGKKNRPPRSPGVSDSIVGGMYTATRQRLDMFTSEEQAILSDVEPVMQSIRRIMHLSGYNDGDPLSAEDQSFVLDNVFNYHPDKEAKKGAGIDHVTVNKHSSFQDSRCFYIVSTDGCRQDFSYRKCLDSFIRGKYPDLADEFLGKYFRKPRSAGNRERSLPPLPEENREGSLPPVPEESRE